MTFAQSSQYDVEQLVAGAMVGVGLVWTILFTVAFDAMIDHIWV